MIVALVLLLATGEDPRIPIAEAQLARRPHEALIHVEATLSSEPATASELGFHYLRGHLLEELGRRQEAQRAFHDALRGLPQLSAHSLYRLALNQFHTGHPEVAAGLLARLLGDRPPQLLVPEAAELLHRSLELGGECRLLDRMGSWPLDDRTRRRLALARADCVLRSGDRLAGSQALLRLLEEDVGDEPARAAAERIDDLLAADSDDVSLLRAVGMAFYRHRRFEHSIPYLSRGLGDPNRWLTDLTTERDFETLYALARSNFWLGNYILAASQFGHLAATVDAPGEKARALYQQGRCWELHGSWEVARQSYESAYRAEEAGDWADAALLAAMRVQWRVGYEAQALELYEVLGSRSAWQKMRNRASLFLATSDLVRGRFDRAGRWLGNVRRADEETAIELAYWSGRLREAAEPDEAVESYLQALLADAYHPLSRAALERLRRPALAPLAEDRAHRLAASGRSRDLYAAWLLLGDRTGTGREARRRLLERLRDDRLARPYLELRLEPPASWPIWEARLTRPEELLLALGVWRQGSPAVLQHFPVTDASLAYTGSRILGDAGETRPSIRVAEILRQRVPPQLPAPLVPVELRRLLYPLPHEATIRREAGRRSVDPFLLAALIREESRFDRDAISRASARGLTQFVLPTAERLAGEVGIERLEAAQLHDPEVSIALGAAYLAELARRYGNRADMVLAAYNAGEPQTRVWRSYCYSQEPEEFFSKVGFVETRGYLRKVLSSREQYAELYGAAPAP